MLEYADREKANMAGEQIIIVDDDPQGLDFCSRILEDAGYQVAGVATGHEAVEIARRQRYDLALTDFANAARDGLGTIRQIKMIEPSVVGVAMTGPLGLDTALETLRSGVDDLIVKPFSPPELRRTVSSALEKGQLQRENIRLRALIPLYELSKAFMGMTQLDQLLAEIVQVSCRESDADRASLMLWDEDRQALTIQAAIGLPDDIVENTVIRLGQGISGKVAEQRRPLVLDSNVPAEDDLRKLMKLDQISSAISVPLTAQDELVGVLNLSKLRHNTSSFTAGSLELASVLAGQAAIAIKKARLFEESQRAYQELKKLDELKSDFINVASHELRTPLAILLGYAYLLEEQSTEVTHTYAQAILKSAMRLKRLITDMLNVRALEAGQMEPELQPLQVADVVQAVVQELGFLAEKKGQSLTANVPSDLPALWADEGKVHLILSHLVSNAIKFTPQGGKIEIDAVDSEDQLTLSVRDTGVGIAPEEFDSLFVPFYQVGGSLRRAYPGMGLGLSIAREMVQLHHGKLWLSSELGKGSTFFFTLPRHLGPRI